MIKYAEINKTDSSMASADKEPTPRQRRISSPRLTKRLRSIVSNASLTLQQETE